MLPVSMSVEAREKASIHLGKPRLEGQYREMCLALG